MSKINTLIFDLDGTLIDSVPDIQNAVNKLLEQEGRRHITRKETIGFLGNGPLVTVEKALKLTGETDEEKIHRLAKDYTAKYNDIKIDNTTLWKGVAETLDFFKKQNFKMAVCTNKPYKPAIKVLKQLEIYDFFPVIAGLESCEKRKPDKAPLLNCIKQLGSIPENSVMIGDSSIDVQAAINAKIPSIVMSYGYAKGSPYELGADIVIDSFFKLPKSIEKLS